MLNMIEWWICLVMPQDEIEDIARFKNLTEEQKQLMLSARKEPKKYTEGVVLSENMEALFRNVPPSLYLSLAGTEKDEKTERARYMKQFGITEVEAAEYVGKMIDYYRVLRKSRRIPFRTAKEKPRQRQRLSGWRKYTLIRARTRLPKRYWKRCVLMWPPRRRQPCEDDDCCPFPSGQPDHGKCPGVGAHPQPSDISDPGNLRAG